jgi:THO complex subunit 5
MCSCDVYGQDTQVYSFSWLDKVKLISWYLQISKLQAGAGFTFDKKRHSRPYKWVQHLGGIDILPESPPHFQEKDGGGMNGDSSKAGNSNSLVAGLATYRLQHRVSNILHQLRVRRKGQLALK